MVQPTARSLTIAAVAASLAIGTAVVALNTGGAKVGPKGLGRPPGSVPATTAAPPATSPQGGGSSSGSNSGASGAKVPHNNVVNIYNLFGLDPSDRTLLDDLTAKLKTEGYEVTQFKDVTEGAGSQGGATFENFKSMAKNASVIIFNGHGFDQSGNFQTCTTGKAISRCGTFIDPAASIPPTTSSNTAAPTSTTAKPAESALPPGLQLEWYPTWAAEQRAYKQYIAQGIDASWLVDPYGGGNVAWAPTQVSWRPGDGSRPKADGTPSNAGIGARPWIGISAAGIAHYFSGSQIELVDVLACQSIGLASSFGSTTYFGHASTGCANFEAVDEPKLFDRLLGKSGVPARATTAAFALNGFQDRYFQISSNSNPVVLSPAVESITPPDGSQLLPNTNTPATVQFDAEMDASNADGVVTLEGCGATIKNPKWNGETKLGFDIAIPKNPTGSTITVTVHQSRAKASPADSPNHSLDGNADPQGASGEAPNRDDYTYQLSCAPPTGAYKIIFDGTATGHYDVPNFGQAFRSQDAKATWHLEYIYGDGHNDYPDPATAKVKASGKFQVWPGNQVGCVSRAADYQPKVSLLKRSDAELFSLVSPFAGDLVDLNACLAYANVWGGSCTVGAKCPDFDAFWTIKFPIKSGQTGTVITSIPKRDLDWTNIYIAPGPGSEHSIESWSGTVTVIAL